MSYKCKTCLLPPFCKLFLNTVWHYKNEETVSVLPPEKNNTNRKMPDSNSSKPVYKPEKYSDFCDNTFKKHHSETSLNGYIFFLIFCNKYNSILSKKGVIY